MAATRTFEGTSLPALLARVRAEVGDDATIVSANKRRSGGVGGFFSKELFEVVVEVEGAPSPGTLPARVADALPEVPADPMAALLGLADATSARECQRPAAPAVAAVVAQPVVTPPAPAARPAPALPAAAAPAPAPAPAFSALYDRAVAIASTSAPAAAASTAVAVAEPTTFSELLAARLGPPGASTSVAAAPAALAPVEPAAAGALADDDDEPGVLGPVVTGRTRRTPRRLSRIRPAFADAPRLRREDLADAPDLPGPDVALPVEETDLLAVDEPAAASPRPARTTLSALGLPVGYLPDDELDEAAVASALAGLPTSARLTRRLRGAIVIMGAPDQARRLAADVAEELLGDASAVLVAQRDSADVPAWLWLRHPADVASRRAGWMQRKAPVVVALCVPAGEDGMAWAALMAGALRPTVLHVAVPAATDGERLRALLGELPPVDGLHLVGVASAPAPAVALSTGVAVVSLDGGAATPEAWAELLVGRVRDGEE